MDNMEVLTAIIAIETFVIIVLTIILLKKRSSGIEPTTADLFKEMLKKIPSAKASEEDSKYEELKKEIGEKMKAEISKTSQEIRRIEAQLKVLQASMEKLFNQTISTTFDDLRKHAWAGKPSEENYSELSEKKADERFEEIRKEMSEQIKAEISEISKKTKRTDTQIRELRDSMEELLEKAITESRHVKEDRELETMKNIILYKLLNLKRQGIEEISYSELSRKLGKPSENSMLAAAIKLLTEELIATERKGKLMKFQIIRLTLRGIEKAEEIESLIFG